MASKQWGSGGEPRGGRRSRECEPCEWVLFESRQSRDCGRGRALVIGSRARQSIAHHALAAASPPANAMDASCRAALRLHIPVFLLAALTSRVAAHSNLGYPLPYNRLACKAGARWCHGGCPPLWRSGWARARNRPGLPAAVWRRGQTVDIVYHKNNHRGGFFRRSLVPVRHMFDNAWHCRGAFEWGCWSQGAFKCGRSQLCGEDQFGLSYKTKMKVPLVFPDGDYVFAQVWYGGVFWRGTRPEFPDYTACSFVRIRGGPTAPLHHPTFSRGHNRRRSIPNGVCETGSLWPDECGGRACIHKKVKYTKPGEFLRGRRPPPVQAAFYRGVNKPKFHPAPKPRPRYRKRKWTRKRRQTKSNIKANGITRWSPGPWRKKVSPKNGNPILQKRKDDGPVYKIRIQVGDKVVSRLRDGERAWLRVGNKPIYIEAFTARARPKAVYFKVHGRNTWTEREFPYMLQGNVGQRRMPWRRPVYNRWFELNVVAQARNRRLYTTKIRLFLKK